MRNRKIDVFYIDPQSSGNLYIYAYRLLSNIRVNSLFISSRYYDYLPLPAHVRHAPIFSYYRFRNIFLQGLSYLFSCSIILSYLLRYRPRVVHLQWIKMPYFELFFYQFIKRILGFQLVFTAHNVLPHDTGNRYADIYRRWYSFVDAIIVHAKDSKDDLVRQFGVDEDKVHVIMHGLLSMQENITFTPERLQELDMRYGLRGKMVFASLGAQSFYKGVDLLVEVWMSTAELRDNNQLKLLVVGPNKGVDVSPLHDIPNVVVNEERIPDDEFFYLLARTDVYLLPYRSISQSGALLTALSLHVPVLATAVGGLKEPFSQGRIGWQMNQASSDTLRDSLLYLIQHPEEVQYVRNDQETWQRVCAFFDWKAIGERTEKLYAYLSKGKKTPV